MRARVSRAGADGRGRATRGSGPESKGGIGSEAAWWQRGVDEGAGTSGGGGAEQPSGRLTGLDGRAGVG